MCSVTARNDTMDIFLLQYKDVHAIWQAESVAVYIVISPFL